MKRIIIKIKTVYGKELIYPVCENALLFCYLTGKKTLDKKDIDIISNLGFKVMTETETSYIQFN